MFVDNDRRPHLLPEGFEPTDNDVVCGRGRYNNGMPGNQRFNEMVRSSALRYQSAGRRVERSMIVAQVVTQLLGSGVRFVKPFNGRFVELTKDQIHEKTGHAIRDLLKEGRKKEQRRARNKAKRERAARLKKETESSSSSSDDGGEATPNMATSSAASSSSTSPVPSSVPSSSEILPPTVTSSAVGNSGNFLNQSVPGDRKRQSSNVFSGGLADTLMEVLFEDGDKKPAAGLSPAKRRQSSMFAPLPLSGDTKLDNNSDIYKVFEILSDESEDGVC